MLQVCKEEDDFVREKLRWVVMLDNGERVYQDDDRPGVDPPSAWRRLKLYCQQEGVHIVRMYIQFRSNIVEVGPEAPPPGFYFTKTAMAVCGEGEHTYHGYLAGYLIGDRQIAYKHWITPSLVLLGEGIRDLTDKDGDSLISRQDAVDGVGSDGI